MIASLKGVQAEVSRFIDQITPKKPEEENKPEETSEDIIARIRNNLTDMGN